MSSASELTDLDNDEEFSISTKNTKTKTKGKSKGEGYKICGALKVPRATTYTCQSLYEQIHAQDIDLQPEYQRAVVWPDAKQIGLIDSIFRNFYVPPVIFVVHFQDDGAEGRVCVDGKQRLTSIYRFIGGEIPYKDAFTGEKFVMKATGSIKAKVLPEQYRKLFLNKQIVCMEYQDITPANEREIFQRVQLGMALTPAEKLQSISGPRADFVRDLLDTYVVDQLASQISWDISRANDFRGLASAVYAISRWPRLNTMPSLSVIESWLQEPEDLEEDFCEDVQNTFRIFCALAKDPKLSQPFWLSGVKKVAPLEVIAIAVLVHVQKKKMSMAQLSEAIGLFRTDVRTTEKDIRQNTRTMKLFLTFLKELKPSQVKPDPGSPTAYMHQTTAGKRKRSVKSPPDEDVDMIISPTLRNSTRSSTHTPVLPATSPRVPPPPASISRRPPSTEPAAIRDGGGTSLPPRPAVPLPPRISDSRQNSLGDNHSARISAPQPPALGPSGSRTYDPSRDPRNSAYHSPNPGDVGPSWARR